MRTPPLDGHPAYASAAHAARLIGKDERTVQLWMKDAGYASERVSGAGYPVALLCAVVNEHKWPHKFLVTPEHFNSDVGASEIADDPDPNRTNENPAALALLSDLHRALVASADQQAAMARDLAELRAQMAALLQAVEQRHERDEMAAQSREDATARRDAALERIEQGMRRLPWWQRILGR